MPKNITGFEFNEDPTSPNSKASANNLNKAIEDATIKNIAPNAVTSSHISGSVAGAGLGGGEGSPLYVKTDNSTVEILNDSVGLMDSPIIGTSKLVDGSVTMDKLADTVKDAINNVLKKIYKVGDYFITHNAESPASRFGGTWELLKDRFLIGAGGDYEILSTGGEKEHTLSVDELPEHNHQINDKGSGTDRDWGNEYFNLPGSYKESARTKWVTSNVGSGKAHNNMPPYKAVYIWVKISDTDEEESEE